MLASGLWAIIRYFEHSQEAYWVDYVHCLRVWASPTCPIRAVETAGGRDSPSVRRFEYWQNQRIQSNDNRVVLEQLRICASRHAQRAGLTQPTREELQTAP
jgi:hypothetical protein